MRSGATPVPLHNELGILDFFLASWRLQPLVTALAILRIATCLTTNVMTNWLSILHSLYPNGLYYKDLSRAVFDRVVWTTIAAADDPICLKIHTQKISEALKFLVEAGCGPATECAFLGETETYGTIADIALRVSGIRGETGYLFIGADFDPLRSRLPLTGKSILITRAASQAGKLAALLRSKGAKVIELPAIEIVLQAENFPAVRQALRQIAEYSWMILTSVNSVSILDGILREERWSWKIFDGLRIACIGTATAEAVTNLGGKVAVVPPLFQAESLAEELIKAGIRRARILLPRAGGSRAVLPELLQKEGAIVDEIHLYRAELPAKSRPKMASIFKDHIDFVTFTSSSTVQHFLELAKEFRFDFSKTRIACIGPITAATLREHGLVSDVEATEFTMQGLVDAIISAS